MLRTIFIGIDKYADGGIRELSGACRDARAFRALVADSIPTADINLVMNEAATVDAIRQVLKVSLGAASEDDTVVVAFSGHGTKSHRLVAHDTTPSELDRTTVGMDELASLFRSSRARAILCVIDCCFSGAAPARVLEESPVSRDPVLPLQDLAGNGRIIISACKANEVAYESPVSRHGLLTQALLEALQEGDRDTVDLTAAMATVMEKVRASAGALGIVQTPVMLGHIEGGLTLPRLIRGAQYRTDFPELVATRISEQISDLSTFGIPAPVLSEWSSRFSGGLNALQISAVNDYRILTGDSLLVVAPTSAGKTFIGEMAAARAIADGRKAVFLLPYRALVNEKYDLFLDAYGENLGMRVIRCTGDHSDQTGDLVRGKYDIAVLTYEMFLNVVVRNQAMLHQIGLVVLDEAQFITDPWRGIVVELLLAYLISARQRGIAPQLIALSAVIGDVNNFHDWLGCRNLVTTARPVPLIEGVLDRTGQFQFLDIDGTERLAQFLPRQAIQVRREKPSAQDVIVPLVQQLVRGTTEKIIVFRNMRGPAEGCAAYLARDVGLGPASDALQSLPTQDLSSTSAALRSCLTGGTAFHNTNLTREEKQVVERAFREPSSHLRILAATTTVAAGINTPASTVIIAEQEFIGEDGRAFTVAEYKNMAGRAGRLGYNEQGKAIILANDAGERQLLFRRYVVGALEPLRSSFDIEQLDTWVVRLLAHVKRIPKTQVVGLLMTTYGGYLANRHNPSWLPAVEARLAKLLDEMLRLGLLEQEGDEVQLTLLGRACGESSLSFRSALRLVDLVKAVGLTNVTAEGLMALVQGLPESDSTYTPMMKKGTKESIRPQEAASRFGAQIVSALQRMVDDQIAYWARCKRASILWDWITGTPVEEIEARYTVTPFQGKLSYGDIRRFADATRFHLRAAHQITAALFVTDGLPEGSMEQLLRQLETGVPADALSLIEVPVDLARGDYLSLRRAGIRNPEQLWKKTDAEIISILGNTNGSRVVSLRARVNKTLTGTAS